MFRRQCVGSLPKIPHETGAPRSACIFAPLAWGQPAEALPNLDTCFWCADDAQFISNYYNTSSGMRAVRDAYAELGPTGQALAEHRLETLPFLRAHIAAGSQGICCGTEDGESCRFSRQRPGEPVSNTGMRCLWCRPNLSEALRNKSSRYELRKSFGKLQRQYQLMLHQRLPINELDLWRPRSEPEIQEELESSVPASDPTSPSAIDPSPEERVREFFAAIPDLNSLAPSSSFKVSSHSHTFCCKKKKKKTADL